VSSPISRDYARKPELIGDLSHVEWMKQPTFRALQWIRLRKESEFKKPYREDDHVPMEHWADYPFPVFTFPPFPNFPGPVPPADSPCNLRTGEAEEKEFDTKCPVFVYCCPSNPTTIVAGETEVLLVNSCPPPNTLNVSICAPLTDNPERWHITVGPTYLGMVQCNWAISLKADADACGVCTIKFEDPAGPYAAYCTLLCDTGVWTKVGNCRATAKLLCYVAGGCPNGSPFNYVIGNHKWAFYEDTQCLKSAATSVWEEYPGSGYDCAGHEPPGPYNTPYLACGGQEPCAERDGVSCYFHMRYAYHYTWGCA